jgi:hypothetical protein
VGPEKIAILGLSAIAGSAATSSMSMNNERKGKAMSDICYSPNKKCHCKLNWSCINVWRLGGRRSEKRQDYFV